MNITFNKTAISILASFFACFSTSCFSQTYIPGGNVSGIWVKANSPYYINGSITIPDNQTLNIESGVSVIFTGYYSLNVQGSLLAIGEENDIVIFSINDNTNFEDPTTTSGGWNRIVFDNTATSNDTSKIVYCKVQYSKAVGDIYEEEIGGGIYLENFDKLIIENSVITNNLAKYLGGGIFCSNSNFQIVKSVVSNNKCDGEWGPAGGGIFCSNSSPHIESVSIVNNVLLQGNGMGGGLSLWDSSSPNIINCLIANNIATNTAGGIDLWYSSNPIIVNSTIVNNSSSSSGLNFTESQVDIQNTIVYGNTPRQIHLSSYAPNGISNDISISFSNIEGGIAEIGNYSPDTLHWEANNISSPPLFSDEINQDYALANGSPCIDKGDPNSTVSEDINGVSRPQDGDGDDVAICDMGAYEYRMPINNEAKGTVYITANGIGVGENSPKVGVDISGLQRIQKQEAEPEICTSSNDGALALTKDYKLCICIDGMGWQEYGFYPSDCPCTW